MSIFTDFQYFFYFRQEFDLTNERFLVPEMLFHPADLGLYSITISAVTKYILRGGFLFDL